MRKAQVAGTNAMLLVLVIAGFILLYILFLPPAEREELLTGNKTIPTKPVVVEEGIILLLETPGTLQPELQKTFEHNIDSFSISTFEEDKVVEQVQSIYVSTTRNTEKTKKIIVVFDVKNVKNAKLNFKVTNHKGKLIILLNDEEIFNGEVENYIEPLSLKNLQDKNIIELKASPVGWRIWETNFYEIEDLKITATVKEVKNQEATESFYISEEEGAQIRNAYLYYYVNCNKIGSLAVYVNNAIISSGMPDCGSLAKKTVTDKVATGRNELRFYTEEGSFLFDNVKVVTELKEALNPTYYFEVNKTHYDAIQDSKLQAVLTMKFADKKRKVIDITINGHKTQVDTESDAYSRTLTKSWIEKGSNYITLVPKTTVKIPELKIQLK